MNIKKENGSALEAQKPLEVSNYHESDLKDVSLNPPPGHQEILSYRPITVEAMRRTYDKICSQYQENLQAGLYEGFHI